MSALHPSPVASMTGFARTDGQQDGIAWAWELRSVNGRGLDLKLRLAPGFDAMEPRLREAAGQILRRGNVTAAVNRQAEGSRLAMVLATQLDEIIALRDAAIRQAADQPAAQRAKLTESLEALLRDAPGSIERMPEERVAQEIALLANRADVREEIDRLGSHIEAARALLTEGAAIGRRFDFLVQEFVREVNTLCSKSASIKLTTIGLRLKATIEQLREQVQNVE